MDHRRWPRREVAWSVVLFVTDADTIVTKTLDVGLHGVRLAGASGGDQIAPLQVTALTAFGAKMDDGTFAGGRRLRSRDHDETLQGHGVSTWVTTRTLKRRGRRPH